jgi:adenylate cyclase
MATEIERKFLVAGNGWRKQASRGKNIRQAYLVLDGPVSMRVRIIGGTKAWVTIKGTRSGISRAEFEYPIPLKDARALMKLRTGRVIKKTRHEVKVGTARFEVDVFKDAHRGLVIAEIELASTRSTFKRPDWLGQEVTHQRKYYNASLAR